MKKIILQDNQACFVCGKKNPGGLQASFTIDRENLSIKGEFTPGEIHQGFAGIVHGGIIATLLDEAMVKLAFEAGIYAVTAWMEIKYISPLYVGEKLHIEAQLTKTHKRLLEGEAEAKTSEGRLIARAKGKLLKV